MYAGYYYFWITFFFQLFVYWISFSFLIWLSFLFENVFSPDMQYIKFYRLAHLVCTKPTWWLSYYNIHDPYASHSRKRQLFTRIELHYKILSHLRPRKTKPLNPSNTIHRETDLHFSFFRSLWRAVFHIPAAPNENRAILS